jgi:hypothetical protein
MAGIMGIDENMLLIYPNPVQDKLVVRLDGYNFDLRIYDSLGRLVAMEDNILNKAELSTAELAKGVYIIRISSGGAVSWKKVIRD